MVLTRANPLFTEARLRTTSGNHAVVGAVLRLNRNEIVET